jgi:hypothetical protein
MTRSPHFGVRVDPNKFICILGSTDDFFRLLDDVVGLALSVSRSTYGVYWAAAGVETAADGGGAGGATNLLLLPPLLRTDTTSAIIMGAAAIGKSLLPCGPLPNPLRCEEVGGSVRLVI